MRFISIYRPANPAAPPKPTMYEEMGEFMAAAVRAGVLLATDGLGPSGSSDVLVRHTRGNYTVTDGPFAEAKDVVGGYSLIKARDISEAAELAKGCPILDRGGRVEVRPVMKFDM